MIVSGADIVGSFASALEALFLLSPVQDPVTIEDLNLTPRFFDITDFDATGFPTNLTLSLDDLAIPEEVDLVR